MTKEFIPYEQALELKELGFNEQCFAAQKDNIIDYGSEMHSFIYNMDCGDIWVALPLYQQAFRWFREKYGLCIVIKPIDDKKLELGYNLIKNGLIISAHLTYEEAELACVKKLIEIVKNH
jgi:hypothetical protein